MARSAFRMLDSSNGLAKKDSLNITSPVGYRDSRKLT